MHKRGIYFLANDKVIDQATAFLNSLRTHNPNTPLCLIPYDGKAARIKALAAEYNFVIVDDEELLAWCDKISFTMLDKTNGMYRKLAAWNGPFDEFLYIDVDTVLLRSIDVLFPLLQEFDVVTAYSNDPNSRKFVWLDTMVPNDDVTEEEINYSSNMGFILSKKSLFSREGIDALALRARKWAPHMELRCFDQPFLNYAIVKTTRRYTSLRCLNQRPGAPRLPDECWPADDGWRFENDGTSSYKGSPRDVLHVHWSGLMLPRKWEKRLYAFLNRCGIATPSVRLNFKQGRLWRYYRDMRK